MSKETEKILTVTIEDTKVTLDIKGLTPLELLGIGEHIKATAVLNISNVVKTTHSI